MRLDQQRLTVRAMTTTTLKTFARGFITLRPKRDPNVPTQRANLAAAFIIVTQFADFLSTVIGLSRGASEANGIMATLLAQYGIAGFAIAKVVGASLLVWVTYRRRIAPWVVGAIYSAVVVWNTMVVLLWH